MTEVKSEQIKILKPVEMTISERGLRVMHGTPTALDNPLNTPGVEGLIVPNTPHVFNVDELTVSDRNHSNESLSNVNVMMGHGIRDASNEWKFLNGSKVVETVNTYNQYAGIHGLRPIELLVVCNESTPDPDSMNIKIGEFPESQNIAYAVGEKVSVVHGDRSRVESGKTFMEVETQDEMFGLDKLIDSNKLGEKIRIL